MQSRRNWIAICVTRIGGNRIEQDTLSAGEVSDALRGRKDLMCGCSAGETPMLMVREKENNRVIGTVLEYRTKAAAERAAEALRININSTTPRTSVLGWHLWRACHAPHIARELDVDQQQARSPEGAFHGRGKSPSSKRWILPRWGKTPINEMEPIVIEDWLSELGRGDSKLENGTRLKMQHHERRRLAMESPRFLPRDAQANPVKYVRQSGRSSKEHTILTQEQAMALDVPERTGPIHGLAGRYHWLPGE